MRLTSAIIEGRRAWGVVSGDEFLDVGDQMTHRYPDLKAAVAAGLEGVAQVCPQALPHSLHSLTWLPVIPNPDKILCVGLNYEIHRQETGRPDVRYPTISRALRTARQVIFRR